MAEGAVCVRPLHQSIMSDCMQSCKVAMGHAQCVLCAMQCCQALQAVHAMLQVLNLEQYAETLAINGLNSLHDLATCTDGRLAALGMPLGNLFHAELTTIQLGKVTTLT